MTTRKPTFQEIRASIPRDFRDLLDTIPPNELKPSALVKWVAGMFRLGRKENHPDSEIVGMIFAFARDRKYTDTQIGAVLDDWI